MDKKTSAAKSAIWLETDLEPDDVLAIYILARRGFIPAVVVVGEGLVAMKVERMQRFLTMLREERLLPGDQQVTVLQGQDSNKLFVDDGKEFTPACEGKQQQQTLQKWAWDGDVLRSSSSSDDKSTTYFKLLAGYLSSAEHPLLVVLKPPRELMQCLTMRKMDVSKCDLWLYGSFNLRCLMKEAVSFEWLNNFHRTLLYESFHATGERNSVHDKVMPDLFSRLRELSKSSSPYMATLFKLIGLWNKHILNECMKDCARHEKNGQQDRLARSTKIVESVKPFIDSQMVLADFALAAAAAEPSLDKAWKPVDVTWNAQGYSVLKANDKSTMYVCCDIDWKTLEAVLVRALAK